jgi:hypothetical protein
MTDNLEIEPGLFYNTEEVQDSEADNPSEPEEAVNDEPEEEEVEAEAEQAEDEAEAESEESDVEDALFTIDDQDITEETVLSWKQAYEDIKSMQADYTRKTQGIAETVKQKVAEATEKELSEVRALKSVLEELATVKDEDLDELLEYDTDKYKQELKRKEDIAKALDKARKLDAQPKGLTEEKATEVYNELIKMHDSEWVKGEDFTDAYANDMKLLEIYIKDNSFTAEEYQSSFNAKTLDAIIKAAKYEKSISDAKKTQAKLKPVIKSKKSKVKAQAAEKEKSLTDYFYNN